MLGLGRKGKRRQIQERMLSDEVRLTCSELAAGLS